MIIRFIKWIFTTIGLIILKRRIGWKFALIAVFIAFIIPRFFAHCI